MANPAGQAGRRMAEVQIKEAQQRSSSIGQYKPSRGIGSVGRYKPSQGIGPDGRPYLDPRPGGLKASGDPRRPWAGFKPKSDAAKSAIKYWKDKYDYTIMEHYNDHTEKRGQERWDQHVEKLVESGRHPDTIPVFKPESHQLILPKIQTGSYPVIHRPSFRVDLSSQNFHPSPEKQNDFRRRITTSVVRRPSIGHDEQPKPKPPIKPSKPLTMQQRIEQHAKDVDSLQTEEKLTSMERSHLKDATREYVSKRNERMLNGYAKGDTISARGAQLIKTRLVLQEKLMTVKEGLKAIPKLIQTQTDHPGDISKDQLIAEEKRLAASQESYERHLYHTSELLLKIGMTKPDLADLQFKHPE